MEFYLIGKSKENIPKYNFAVAACFSTILIKTILKNNNYVLKLGIPPVLPMPLHVLLVSHFAPPAFALPMLAHAACAYI